MGQGWACCQLHDLLGFSCSHDLTQGPTCGTVSTEELGVVASETVWLRSHKLAAFERMVSPAPPVLT